jgi:hypothetical protein
MPVVATSRVALLFMEPSALAVLQGLAVLRSAASLTLPSSGHAYGMPLKSNVRRFAHVMNRSATSSRCKAGRAIPNGRSISTRRAVGIGLRGLSVLRRPSHRLWPANRRGSTLGALPSMSVASSANKNTTLRFGMKVVAFNQTPNPSVKRTAPGVPGSAAYLKR